MGATAISAALAFVTCACLTTGVRAQQGYLVVAFRDELAEIASAELFDRELHSMGAVTEESVYGSFVSVTTDASLTRWIADPHGKLRPVDASGTFLDPVTPGAGGIAVATAGGGLVDTGYKDMGYKLEALSPAGEQLWLVPLPTVFTSGAFNQVVTATGEVWLGGTHESGFINYKPAFWQVDPATGATLSLLEYSSGPLALTQLMDGAGAPDGTLWWAGGGWIYEPYYWAGVSLVNTQGGTVIQSLSAGEYGQMGPYSAGFAVDARGRLLMIDYHQQGYSMGPQQIVTRYDPAQPTQSDASWDLEKTVFGSFALGPTGEELFVVVLTGFGWNFRLCRLNLVTGAKSSIPLSWGGSALADFRVLHGDPTGFVYANVTNRVADTDGDGARNGEETFAGSDPFDASSRPDGPKIGISFTESQAIQLTVSDPDGLLDPIKGIDIASLSLQTDAYGEMLPGLLTVLTSVTLTPDGTGVRAIFGALPLPSDLKIRIKVSVKDLTGATASDWQVTPPGDL